MMAVLAMRNYSVAVQQGVNMVEALVSRRDLGGSSN